MTSRARIERGLWWDRAWSLVEVWAAMPPCYSFKSYGKSKLRIYNTQYTEGAGFVPYLVAVGDFCIAICRAFLKVRLEECYGDPD